MDSEYANQEVSYLVIGAGIAGLTAARTLRAAGFRVLVLDKGRGVGGRMATRRIQEGVFDHGAQFISVRDPRFKESIQAWLDRGIVKVWSQGFPTADGEQKARGHPRYRGHPGMTAIPKALAQGLNIRLATRVQVVGVQDKRWRASTESGEVFWGDALVLTSPVPQSLLMLERGTVHLPRQLAARLRDVAYHPCIALLLLLDRPAQIPEPGGVRVLKGAIRWIADNQRKGISPDATAVTIHATPDFSQRHWDAEDAVIADRLLSEAKSWVQGPVRTFQVHRWRYSRPVEPITFRDAILPGLPPLMLAGDAFGGGRVEGAALSGLYAAERLLESL